MGTPADVDVLSAAFRLGAEIVDHPRFRDVQLVRLWRRTIAASFDAASPFVVANMEGRRLYNRIRRQERHRVNMTWPAYREEYEARVARMRRGAR